MFTCFEMDLKQVLWHLVPEYFKELQSHFYNNCPDLGTLTVFMFVKS